MFPEIQMRKGNFYSFYDYGVLHTKMISMESDLGSSPKEEIIKRLTSQLDHMLRGEGISASSIHGIPVPIIVIVEVEKALPAMRVMGYEGTALKNIPSQVSGYNPYNQYLEEESKKAEKSHNNNLKLLLK